MLLGVDISFLWLSVEDDERVPEGGGEWLGGAYSFVEVYRVSLVNSL